MDSRRTCAFLYPLAGRVVDSMRSVACMLALAALLVGSGCVSSGGANKLLDKTLAMVGMAADTQDATPQSIPLRLYAGDNLNAADDRRALAVVVRVYQLRSLQRFQDTPFDDFLDADREREALGDDLIDVREILLMPGQRHEITEQLTADGAHLGVVALFRAPARSRWRLAFDTVEAADEGITIGLHACAMTTTSPALATRLAGEPHGLSTVNCASTAR